MTIQIDGLTHDQVTLLNIIYSHESYEDLMDWTYTLNRKLQLEVLTLIQLVLHETIEVEMIRPMTSYPDAERIINRIKKSNTP